MRILKIGNPIQIDTPLFQRSNVPTAPLGVSNWTPEPKGTAMTTIPDFPPAPGPGELVLVAFECYPLTEDDWSRFRRGVDAYTENWRQVLKAREDAGSDVYISPVWEKPLSEQFAHESRRLEGIGAPEWRLWDAYARELELGGM